MDCDLFSKNGYFGGFIEYNHGFIVLFQYGALHVRPGYHEEYENHPERYKGRSMLVSSTISPCSKLTNLL